MSKLYDGKIIALKKGLRRNLIGLSERERLYEIRKDAAVSQRVERLLEYGFNEIKFEDSMLSDPEVPVINPSGRDTYFQRLGNIGAYVFHSKNSDNVSKFKELLDKDYEFIPNHRLYLPPTLKTDKRGNRAKRNSIWPDVSGISDAHKEGITGEGVFVAVLDTGCDADHSQFSEQTIDFRYIHPTNTRRLRKVRGFDTDGHGTHVCGIIGGKTVGISPDVSLKVASVIESETAQTSVARLLTGLEWVASKYINQSADYSSAILNLSLGFPEYMKNKTDLSLLLRNLENALDTLLFEFDILSIVAIGNDGDGYMRFPGMSKNVLSVGAIDFNMQAAKFSGGGIIHMEDRMEPNVCGFGVDVYSALERNREGKSVFGVKSGTSMATPYVTGIAALLAQKTKLKGVELRNYIVENVYSLPNQPQTKVGAGLVRYYHK